MLLLCTMEKFHSTDTCSHDTTSHNTQNHGYSIVLLLHRPQLMLLLRVLEVLLGAVGSSHSDRSRTTHSSQHCHRSRSILLTLHIPELLLLVVAVLLVVECSGHPNRMLQTHSSPNRGCSDTCNDHRLDNTLLGMVSFHLLLLHECLIHK